MVEDPLDGSDAPKSESESRREANPQEINASCRLLEPHELSWVEDPAVLPSLTAEEAEAEAMQMYCTVRVYTFR